MAVPIGSVSAPPISTTFQPGSTNARIGTGEQEPRTNQPQPREAAAAESQRQEDRSLAARDEQRAVAREASASDSQPRDNGSAERGSVVDIEV